MLDRATALGGEGGAAQQEHDTNLSDTTSNSVSVLQRVRYARACRPMSRVIRARHDEHDFLVPASPLPLRGSETMGP